MTESTTPQRFTMPVFGDKLAKGHVLVGESGGESAVYAASVIVPITDGEVRRDDRLVVVTTEHGPLHLDPAKLYDVLVEVEPWWVYIERDQGRPDMALGPYPTEEDAERAMEHSMLVEGEMTSREGGTDCYTVAQSAMTLGIGEDVTRLVHVFVDLDDPDHTGK